MRIIFFHHAGGDRYAFSNYRRLAEELGWEMEVYEFPGHGDRFNESLLESAEDIARDARQTLGDLLLEDYVILANSMGSLAAYLMMHLLQEEAMRLPVHFIAAARKCPASYPAIRRSHSQTDEDFWQMIRDYGGPGNLLDNPELRELYGPILRADYRALETYEHVARPRLRVPATILYGSSDRYSSTDMLSWEQHFSGKFNLLEFEGGHFFVYEQPGRVIDVVRRAVGEKEVE